MDSTFLPEDDDRSRANFVTENERANFKVFALSLSFDFSFFLVKFLILLPLPPELSLSLTGEGGGLPWKFPKKGRDGSKNKIGI